MKTTIRDTLLSAAALAMAAGLSSCSQGGQGNAGEQNAAEPAGTAQNAGEPAAAQQPSGAEDQSAKNAKALLKAMSDYLAAQQTISLSYDSIFEVVTKDQQKLQLATSGTVLLNRPDKIHTTRQSGFSDTEMVFDGKTVSFLGKGQNAYIQAEAPGTVDNLIDQLRDKFHRQLPGADLLGSDVYGTLMSDVTDVKDLGSGVIGGKECDHIAFRAKETDWQIWIAQGGTPYPCRYVITSKQVDQAPEFTLNIREWKAGSGVGQSDFAFTPPAGAKKLDAKDLEALKETSDLPENYRMGASQ
ncbi:DUF2092 domain-containing protein [Sphingomonas hankyongi]|uniref:DUF2092 domain-containing protein n=1 Tax=Sphingomonas hankyongi TaxID=2908209 RepID=A0ABT0S3T6_9SPHN|nr:DUF2092 domain-containing protein [Sphingomonas hankyongi]MCL6730529.1 DUF2092 domain-containing protein [Sphingomonas hankyongi]